MPFKWSLNPYMGCVHRCTFCYVRHFEQRADRPSDDALRALDPGEDERRRGSAPRARAAVLAARGGRPRHGDRPVPACRGPLPAHPRLPPRARRLGNAVLDRHARAARRPRHRRPPGRGGAGRACRSSSRSRRSTSDVWRTTEPGTAPPRAGSRPCAAWPKPGSTSASASRRSSPGSRTIREQLTRSCRAARAAGARTIWASVVHLRPGVREHFLEALGARLARGGRALRGALRRSRLPAGARRRRPSSSRCGARARHAPSPRHVARYDRLRRLAQLELAV